MLGFSKYYFYKFFAIITLDKLQNSLFRGVEKTYSAFATSVAMASHACSSISPAGSTSLTPLSGAGLCEAVIITPITPEICQDHKNY